MKKLFSIALGMAMLVATVTAQAQTSRRVYIQNDRVRIDAQDGTFISDAPVSSLVFAKLSNDNIRITTARGSLDLKANRVLNSAGTAYAGGQTSVTVDSVAAALSLQLPGGPRTHTTVTQSTTTPVVYAAGTFREITVEVTSGTVNIQTGNDTAVTRANGTTYRITGGPIGRSLTVTPASSSSCIVTTVR